MPSAASSPTNSMPSGSTRARIEQVLGSVGFADIRFHRVVTPDSPRNQDLGMMAHRMFLTCERRASHGASVDLSRAKFG